MAQLKNRLTDVGIKALSEPGRHADGEGLYLKIGNDGRKAWVLLYRLRGKRKEMGLGPAAGQKLKDVRAAAKAARDLVEKGIDPIEDRKAAPPMEVEEEPTPVVTLASFAAEYIKGKAPGWRGRDTLSSWKRTFDLYAAAIGELPIDTIDTDTVLSVLRPIWATKAESASKARERIEMVLDAAKAAGHRQGENPARWRGHLEHFLPKRLKLTRGHHPALPYENVEPFLRRLQQCQGSSAWALQFTLLTAVRETVTLEATWREIDLKTKIWTIPAGRMKTAKDFRVPLSPQAIAVLKHMKPDKVAPDAWIFPGAKGGRPLSDAAMDQVMRDHAPGYVPHGLRSTFRDWAGDETEFPRDLVEEALAHAVGDETERAYRRRDALERRRKLMDEWGSYCSTPRPPAAPAAE